MKWILIVSLLAGTSAQAFDKVKVRLYSNLTLAQAQGLDSQGMRNRDIIPGTIHYIAKPTNSVDVIAELDLETYLAGVLPSEMPSKWPLEALKAQAVAARTYTLFLMRQRLNKHFNLESTVEDQVYDWMNHTRVLPKAKRKIMEALAATRGQYLVDDRGELFKAYYHSDCGGTTETPFNVFNVGPKAGMVHDRHCPMSPMGQWEVRFTTHWMAEQLRQYFEISKKQSFTGMKILNRSPSGRVQDLQVEFDYENYFTMPANEFRRIIGFAKVKSTQFDFLWEGAEVFIKGRGNGHGVGMCQWGSKQMAQLGRSYRDILSYYYPKTSLRTLESDQQLKGLFAARE